jgi:hypothetical protein
MFDATPSAIATPSPAPPGEVSLAGTRAWGLSLGGLGGGGLTYRMYLPDATGWSFSGSLTRFGTQPVDNGLPYALMGLKYQNFMQETLQARLYQAFGGTFLFNPYPSLSNPQPALLGGGSHGLLAFGAGYGMLIGKRKGWTVGLELGFGLSTVWPPSSGRFDLFVVPLPELALMYEF